MILRCAWHKVRKILYVCSVCEYFYCHRIYQRNAKPVRNNALFKHVDKLLRMFTTYMLTTKC